MLGELEPVEMQRRGARYGLISICAAGAISLGVLPPLEDWRQSNPNLS